MLTLNIYNTKTKEVEKTYKTKEADIFFGTIEDLLGILEDHNLNDKDDLMKLIPGLIKILKPLLTEIFDGLTEDELRRTKVQELIPLFIEIVKYSLGEINNVAGTDSKN